MSTTYTPVAKGLHWLMAVLILGLLALGLYMHELPLSPQKLELYSWHKWFGVTAFLLVWLRLAWRVTHRPPALPEAMSHRMQWLAHAGHAVLYGLMFIIPLSGWLMSSAKGVQTVWFGVWPIPDLLSRDKALGDLLAQVHATLNGMLVALLLGHAGAALKHHFIDRDDILHRMLPQFRKPSSQS
jgi:cytochrome b561